MAVPVWIDGTPGTRLAELTADTADPSKEIPLRRDVRSLGILLGRVLVEQEGGEFFGVVEQLRGLLIRHREQGSQRSSESPHIAQNTMCGAPSDVRDPNVGLMSQAREIIRSLPLDTAYRVTKAFAIYFELTNLAETNHRKRRRRAARMLSGKTPVDGSFRGTLVRMRSVGVSAVAMLESLRQVKVTPVFTAHPTGTTRPTIRL